MYKSKRYFFSYEEVEDEGKGPEDLFETILNDPELPSLEEIVIGPWGEAWDGSVQPVVDGIVANKDRFSRIKSLYFGDMDYEDCEVSWIMQADYSELWGAVPQLEKLTIKGSTDLELGEIAHENLQSLEIICGGLPSEVIEQIAGAKLPNLNRLLLYIGVEEYGFDGDLDTIKDMLAKSDFPKLTYLGITDSDMQDEVTEAVLECKYIDQIEVLDLSMGTLTDKGGQLLLDGLGAHPNIKKLDLHYHFLSDEMMKKLENLPVEVDMSEGEDALEYDGELECYPMLTE